MEARAANLSTWPSRPALLARGYAPRQLPHPAVPTRQQTLPRPCRATGDDDDFESLFAQELKRRGMEEKAAAEARSSEASKKDPFQSSTASNTRTRARAPPPSQSNEFEGDDQRKRSVSLVTEGLEGLPARGSELLKLGGSVFLGFLPFMVAFSLLFTGIFAVFGDNFIHGGRPNTLPRYVDPQELLSEPTVDPYIPYR